MGVRTVHQKDARAQLVVKATYSSVTTDDSAPDDSAADSGDEAEWLDAAAAGSLVSGEGGANSGKAQRSAQQNVRSVEMQGLSSDSDVLPVPRFVNAEGALAFWSCKLTVKTDS